MIEIMEDCQEKRIKSILSLNSRDSDKDGQGSAVEVELKQGMLEEIHMTSPSQDYSEVESKAVNKAQTLKIKHRPPMLTNIPIIWHQFSISKDG